MKDQEMGHLVEFHQDEKTDMYLAPRMDPFCSI